MNIRDKFCIQILVTNFKEDYNRLKKQVSKGQIMNDFFNILNVDASAIGNHQFDFGPKFLTPYMNGKTDHSINLAANLRSQKEQKNFLPHQKGERIFTLNSGIKIGVVGLATLETPSTTNGFVAGLFPPYHFLNYTDIVINSSKRLKQAGAHAVLILAHVGNYCNTTNKFGIWDKSIKQQGQCLQTDEMTVLIKSLPEGTIDGVVQGHRHRFSHHFIKGIPVMGTINGGYYFNVMHLKFHNFKLYNAVIEGPIPVCQKVFQKLRTCNYLSKNELKSAGPLVSWKFHNSTVKKHQGLQNLYEKKWFPLMKPYFVTLAFNQITLQKVVICENNLGNLITNLMNSAVPGNDFVIINPGLFRTSWQPGIIQYQHLYNMFPFTIKLISFEMSGKELLDTLSIIQSGSKGFYSTFGLSQNVSLSDSGVKKFISAKFFNGTDIRPQINYRGLTIDFLLNGGDDFRNVIGKVYTLRGQKDHGDFRNLIKQQLIKLGNIQEDSLIDTSHPRLVVFPN